MGGSGDWIEGNTYKTMAMVRNVLNNELDMKYGRDVNILDVDEVGKIEDVMLLTVEEAK